MKTTIILSLALFFLVSLEVNAQRVGIGTTEPMARLAIDSGILIDQSDLNQSNLVAGALQFGSNGLVGIARSTLAGSGARSGLGFFTGGSRRLVIDSLGRVGIGVTTPLQNLHVSGNTYVSGNLGVGISNPLHDIHTANSARIGGYLGVNTDPDGTSRLRVNGDAYFENSNVGIKIAPSSSYSLYVSGASRFTTDLRIDGELNPNNPLTIGNDVTVTGSLEVGGRGIIRGNNSAQWRLVRITVSYAGGIGANTDLIGAALAFGLGGATLAGIFVGPIIQEGAGSTNLESLGLIPTDISSTGCRFLITNGSSTTANMGSASNPTTWQLTLLVFD